MRRHFNSARAEETISALLQTHHSWNALPDRNRVLHMQSFNMSVEKIRTAYALQMG